MEQYKWSNSDVIRSQKKERKIVEQKEFEEIRAENLPNLSKDVGLQFQEAQQTPKDDEPKEIHVKTYWFF